MLKQLLLQPHAKADVKAPLQYINMLIENDRIV